MELLNVPFYYLAFVLAYFVLYQLLRFRPLNRILTHAGFAWLFGQYHAPGVDLADLTRRDPPPSL